MRPLELAVVGAGPTASSLLERVVASAALLDGRSLRVHLVDPHRRGLGRVWRPDQHAVLWMNSMAEDVTMFTDESVTCDGPIRPGPSLYEWARQIDDETLATVAPPPVAAEIRGLAPTTFPTRLVQSAYLEWFVRHVVERRPDHVEIVFHEDVAVDLEDLPDDRQRVTLERGGTFDVDAVVLALGHLDADPPDGGALQRRAVELGLVHLPAGHTAEQDLSTLPAGADVIVLGLGQAFTDLVALVTEGRSGRFVAADGDALRYEASGDEPVLHVGSRRGVPYRTKPDYRLQAPLVALPAFVDRSAIDALLASPGPLVFDRDVRPLLEKDAGWAYYHELFHAHRDRTACDWSVFAARYAAAPCGADLDAVVADHVPAVDDRFDIAAIDRPLAGLRFASRDELHDAVAAHVTSDVARRTDPHHSADLGAFMSMLFGVGAMNRIAGSGRLTERSRVTQVGRWFSFFMYYASGPPPARLRQLLALVDAGLVRFIGAGTTVHLDEERGRFVARSVSHDDAVVADAYVDARIAPISISRTPDRLGRALHGRGDITEEHVRDEDWVANTGKLLTDPTLRVVAADGGSHPRRFAVGAFTNRPAAGAFARPRTNAPSFRQHDALARTVLTALVAPADVSADRAPAG